MRNRRFAFLVFALKFPGFAMLFFFSFSALCAPRGGLGPLDYHTNQFRVCDGKFYDFSAAIPKLDEYHRLANSLAGYIALGSNSPEYRQYSKELDAVQPSKNWWGKFYVAGSIIEVRTNGIVVPTESRDAALVLHASGRLGERVEFFAIPIGRQGVFLLYDYGVPVKSRPAPTPPKKTDIQSPQK